MKKYIHHVRHIKKLKNPKLLTLIGVCLVLFFIALFFFPDKQKGQTAVSVTVASVIQKDVSVQMQTIGTVQAYSSVEIKSMVTGPLLNAGFKEGDVVERDQMLFTIDPRTFVASLNQAKANLARDQATLSNYQLQVERNTPLVKKGYLDKQNFDTLVTNVKSMEATVQADQAAVDNAQLQLSYTTIRAPIPGKTGSILLKPGSIIKANDTSALVTINQINPIYVVFSIPQTKLPSLQEDLRRGPVVVKAVLNNNQIEEGVLTFIDNAVDAATGNIQLKATFENKMRRLWPGEYVTVDLVVDNIKQALLIPSLALLAGQKGFYVYVVDKDSIVHMRTVTPGPVVENQTVIEKGLQLGDKVVTAGQLRIKEGTPVNINSQGQ